MKSAQPKPVPPSTTLLESEREAMIAASMKALGVKDIPRSRADLVFDGLVALCKKLRKAALANELEVCGLSPMQISNAIGDLVRAGRVARLGESKPHFYLPLVAKEAK